MKPEKKRRRHLRKNPSAKPGALPVETLKSIAEEVCIQRSFGMFGLLLSSGSPKVREALLSMHNSLATGQPVIFGPSTEPEPSPPETGLADTSTPTETGTPPKGDSE